MVSPFWNLVLPSPFLDKSLHLRHLVSVEDYLMLAGLQ